MLRIDDLDLYTASFPVFAATGEAIALLEARLPSGEIDASVGSLVRRLLVTAIVLAALAVLAGVILGQQVTGPLGTLSDAVGKLGRGDFSTSIPVGGTQEVGKLGAHDRRPCATTWCSSRASCDGARPRRKPCSAASSKASTPSTSRVSSAI